MAARNQIRSAVARCARFIPPSLLRGLFKPGPKARVLVYHSISEDPHNPFAVSPESFNEQMEHLARHCTVVSMLDLASMIADGRAIPERCVAVTFDDGYEDNYLNAYPTLIKSGIPATIFLVAGSIREDPTSTGGTEPGDVPFLTWDQIREMARNGIEFGSHTMTHPSLALLGPDAIAGEFLDSKALIEKHIGTPVAGAAYPYGTYRDVDRDVLGATRAAGYNYGCTAVNGTCGRDTELFALPRTKIEYGDSHGMFKQALEGAFDLFIPLDRIRMLFGKRDPSIFGIKQGNR